ncbi:MAG: uroporphyrinogen-III C-methyltransferase [SAR324 cluster bacterium]|nr:uroporphyrinogen-III C-methyltransferase [SAR324 cluster bacterium]
MIHFTNTSPSRSKVYLVGAGPGDPGLLTLKAQAVLKRADVVIYDYLANPIFLKYAENAELINAGKRYNQHTLSQDTINELLVEKAQEGKIVVRLKGGDPFLFGRGSEELSAVLKTNIPFEVVPGVSSATGVPVYAGIPLTHRDYSSNVVFLTGVEHPEKEHSMINWEAIAKISTIVVMMGLRGLPNITECLMEAGRAPQTPVVVIQWGTWTRQYSVQGTLQTIAEEVEKNQMEAPVLTIIGQVCQFYQQFNWFEKQPLFGQHILVTRTESGPSSLTELLIDAGAHVTSCPTISIEAPLSWEPFDQIIQNPEKIDWTVFTSSNAIEQCMERLRVLGKDTRIFGSCQIACVGAATATYLEQFSLIADVVPRHYQSEGLADVLKKYDWHGQHVWFPQAEKTRGVLQNKISEWGGIVHSTPVYRNVLPMIEMDPIVALLEEKEINWITFTSSSMVKNFFQLLPDKGKIALKQWAPSVACIGKVTADTVYEHGLSVDLIPRQQDIEGLVAALCGTDCSSLNINRYNKFT